MWAVSVWVVSEWAVSVWAVSVWAVRWSYQCGSVGRDQLDCVAATRNKAHHGASNVGVSCVCVCVVQLTRALRNVMYKNE